MDTEHTDSGTSPELHPRRGKRSHTPADRAAAGKAARAQTPRSTLATPDFGSDRPNPIDLLVEQEAARVQSLIPIRHGRMAESPFTFYRGAALPMAADLSRMKNTGLHVQLCGDAHLLNFGLFGTPERRLVFDINDFDETAVGPFEWDLARLTTSIVLASRERGDKVATTNSAVLSALTSYREAMVKFSSMGTLDVWYSMLDIDEFMAKLAPSLKQTQRAIGNAGVAKIKTQTSVRAAERTTELVDGEPRFISNPPLQVPATDLALPGWPETLSAIVDQLFAQTSQYRSTLSPERRHLFDEYQVVDLARRVVGVGSVGTRCYIMLLVGRDASDPLILQIKEATTSVLERYAIKSRFKNHGERVVVGQKLTQSASDIFLGWAQNTQPGGVEFDYYLRQFRDWKGTVSYDELRPEGFGLYAEVCGWALAKAHARSGDQIVISSYIGTGSVFNESMLDFAIAYADQTEVDHKNFVAAIESGQLEATSGV